MVEAVGGGCDTGAADEAIGRLDAGDAAQGRRAADRAAGVGADAAEDQPCRDPRTGAAAAAGGEMLGIPRVARGRCREIKGRAAIGEFVRRQFSHQHRAGGGELLGTSGVGIRDVVLQEFRPTGRRYPFGIDDVLEADRDAVQWPRVTAGHDRAFGGARVGQCAFFGQVDKGVQLLVERVHTAETGPGQLYRRELLRGDQPGSFSDRRDRVAHARSSSAKP